MGGTAPGSESVERTAGPQPKCFVTRTRPRRRRTKPSMGRSRRRTYLRAHPSNSSCCLEPAGSGLTCDRPTRGGHLPAISARSSTPLERNLAEGWRIAQARGLLGKEDTAASRPSWATTPAVRAVMKANKARDTGPEKRLRSLLHKKGLRYRVNARPIAGLRRTADVVFLRRCVFAVFIDGCYWHGCSSTTVGSDQRCFFARQDRWKPYSRPRNGSVACPRGVDSGQSLGTRGPNGGCYAR